MELIPTKEEIKQESFEESLKYILEDSSNGEISFSIASHLPTITLSKDIKVKVAQLLTYCKLIELIQDVGQFEHSESWDLALNLELNNKTGFYIEEGFTKAKVIGTSMHNGRIINSESIKNWNIIKLQVDYWNDEEDEDVTELFPVKNIESIHMYFND